MTNLLKRGALVLFVTGFVVCAVGFGYRAWRQHENARAFAITTPNGIDEARFVRIGGIDQWITIRGEDRAVPARRTVATARAKRR